MPHDFDPDGAATAALAAIRARDASVTEQVRGEVAEERANAIAYAAHLAAGGDPTEYPPASDRARIIPAYLGMVTVYREWNEARGVPNPLLPFGDRRLWRAAELLASRVGEPVPFSELAAALGRRSPDDVARILVQFEREYDDLVVRRMKVSGASCYLVRRRRPEDSEKRAAYYSIPEEN